MRQLNQCPRGHGHVSGRRSMQSRSTVGSTSQKSARRHTFVQVLIVDGQVIAQSGSCMRYAAAITGLSPKDPLELARCDAIFETSQVPAAPYTVDATAKILVPWQTVSVPLRWLCGPHCAPATLYPLQDLSSVNPIVNVYRGEEFSQKKAAYFETFPAKLAMVAKQLGDGLPPPRGLRVPCASSQRGVSAAGIQLACRRWQATR